MRLNQLATELEINEYSNSVNLDFFHNFLVGFFLPPSIPWVPFLPWYQVILRQVTKLQNSLMQQIESPFGSKVGGM